MLKLINEPFLFPEDLGSGGKEPIESKELSVDEIENILVEDDEDEEVLELPKDKSKKSDDKDDKQETVEDSDESDEEDELAEFEEEEVDESKLDPAKIHATPKEIKKDFPDLFKKYPSLETAYYRDAKFTEIFPSIKDAERAANDSRILDNFEQSLMQGDIKKVLEVVKGDEQAFNKVVDNYLPLLQETDPKAYEHVMGNVVKNIVKALHDAGSDGKDEVLSNAAAIVYRYFFNSTTWEAPTKLSKEEPVVNKAEEAFRAEQQKLRMNAFNEARNDLSTRLDNTLRATLNAHIDPNGSMTDYVKKNAIKDAMEIVHEQMSNDARFKSILNDLWRKAAQSGFDKESKDRIKSAFLARAKPLLSAAIVKARKEALKGISRVKKSDSDEEDDTKPIRRAPAAVGKSTARVSESGKSNQGEKSKIPAGMSTLDFLNS